MLSKLLQVKLVIGLLVFLLVVTPSLAATEEVRSHDFWQEADITFWQTLPFATLWGFVIERQFSALMFPGSSAHWNAIISFAAVVSAGNAWLHAREVVRKDKKD